MNVRLIELERIRVAPKALARASKAKIAQYARRISAGDGFPPIRLAQCSDENGQRFYVIRDGRHRYAAQRELDYQLVEAVVVNGDS
jgi:hypothetical protein